MWVIKFDNGEACYAFGKPDASDKEDIMSRMDELTEDTYIVGKTQSLLQLIDCKGNHLFLKSMPSFTKSISSSLLGNL